MSRYPVATPLGTDSTIANLRHAKYSSTKGQIKITRCRSDGQQV